MVGLKESLSDLNTSLLDATQWPNVLELVQNINYLKICNYENEIAFWTLDSLDNF